MTKLLNIIIIVLALALVAVILYPQIQENRPKVVRFACDSSASCLPFLIGVEESLFVKNRILPELIFYSDPDQALADLFAGNADVGVFPWSTVFKRILDNQETLRVFISEDFRQSLPVDAIVVPAESRIKDLADIKKKKLGYPPQLRDYIQPFLANINLKPEDVTTVEIPFSDIAGKLRQGEIDAAWLLEPLICTFDTVEFRILHAGVLAKYVSAPFPGAAVGFTPEFLKSGKALLARLKISTDVAIALSETRPERAKLILGKYFPYCKEVCGGCRIPELQRLVEINKPSVSALAARLSAAGVFDQDIETSSIFVEPAKLTR